ncbi:hypothetical protein ACIOHS_08020 [Streptomyces sp. NPDC088253]|uniref:hypothetical protein n=1 Tax=Streptomyces sp. NPDC088253 TaxID=3365846 RepID=UPI00381C2018
MRSTLCRFPGLDRPPAAEPLLLAHGSGRENHLLLGHLAEACTATSVTGSSWAPG